MKNATLIFAAAAALVLSSCAACPLGHKSTAKGKVEHIVLIWLKRPGNAADRATVIADARKLQAQIPQIQHLSVGPALPSARSIVDDSFDVGLVMSFASKADMDAYEQHPVYRRAMTAPMKPVVAKILVYDIVSE